MKKKYMKESDFKSIKNLLNSGVANELVATSMGHSLKIINTVEKHDSLASFRDAMKKKNNNNGYQKKGKPSKCCKKSKMFLLKCIARDIKYLADAQRKLKNK